MLGTRQILNPLAGNALGRSDVGALYVRVLIGVVAALAGALLKYVVFKQDAALFIVYLPFTVTAALAGGTAASVAAILAAIGSAALLFDPARDVSAFADPLAFAAASLLLPGVAGRHRSFWGDGENETPAAGFTPPAEPGDAQPWLEHVADHGALTERFAGVAAAAPGALFSLSACVDGGYACHFVSEKAKEVFGIDRAELVRNPGALFERIGAKDRARLRSALEASAGGTEPWQGLFRFAHATKGEIWIEAHAAPARQPDGRIVWHGCACDVTDRNSSQQRIDELTLERSSAIGAMAKTLGHQINQPLTAGTAYLKVAQRLAERLPPENGAMIGETIGKAIAQMMRAGDVVRSLREFVAREEPDKTLVRLNALIEHTVALMEAQAIDADVTIEKRLAAPDDHVVADRAQLKHVLANLLRNAIDAMRGSDCRRLTVSTSAGDGAIRVEIADTGRGLAGIDAARLFEPFAASGAPPEGMGIGLATSRAIIEAHYGSIWTKPNPGGGAVFGFDLPLRDRESSS